MSTMDEDPLMQAVVARAREERQDAWADPRWERLADGTLSASERAELEALAARSPEYAEAMAAFAPLSDAFMERVRREVQAKPAAVVSLSARRAARWGLTAAVAAAAAAVALTWSPSARVAPLPAYTLSLSDGAQGIRGEAPGAPAAPLFYPETTLELILRPASAVSSEATAAGVLVGNGVRVPWRPRLERSEAGVLRVRGAAGQVLPVGPGEWKVLLAVGLPADVARAAAALELSDQVPAGVAVLEASLRVASARP